MSSDRNEPRLHRASHRLLRRLRPFLRRDLRARLYTGLASILVLTALSWLGTSALTRIDSQAAHSLRTELGLENGTEVCGSWGEPACSYDDREQALVDAAFHRDARARLAVVRELRQRAEFANDRLTEAEVLSGALARTDADDTQLSALNAVLWQAAVDLSPAAVRGAAERRAALLAPLEDTMAVDCDRVHFDGLGWVGECDRALLRAPHGAPPAGASPEGRRALLQEIERQRAELHGLLATLDRLERRERGARAETSSSDRTEVIADLVDRAEDIGGPEAELAHWLTAANVASTEPFTDEMGTTLAVLVRTDAETIADLATDRYDELWHDGWTATPAALIKPSERYRSPVSESQRWQLFGTLLLALGGFMLVVVGPVVTATTTAREREAGTLPVLRMTGLSAEDLAAAMAIGPNVFALIAGGGLLSLALPILAWTADGATLLTAVAILLTLSAATHLTAIGLGDALGQRVNAMVVGGLLGAAVVGPGLVGALMAGADMAATGLLLGPLPATVAGALSLTGITGTADVLSGGTSEMGSTILGYALVSQVVLGLLCLQSWRRRVEQPWAPLFRPVEGMVLGLLSVGCSALAIIDLAQRVNVQTYDAVNLLTFVAVGFLLPLLTWLLVASLRRPARAVAMTSPVEARRAFLRFQGVVAAAALALAGSYTLVLHRVGLGGEPAEVMWATLTQVLLLAETGVATLLWVSRRRTGKHRALILGGSVMLLQLVFAAAVYQFEVEFVAMTQRAGGPFLLGMNASPYWLAFLVVLWSAGLGLIFAALLNERDRRQAAAQQVDAVDEDDEDDEENPRRWIH